MIKPPYVSRLRPIEELVDPEMRKLRRIVDEILEEIHAMTPEELVEYQIEIGMRHPDGTLNWPEGEPIGMPYPGDFEPVQRPMPEYVNPNGSTSERSH